MKFSGIPYKVVGGAKFYDRREIKDILAFVRVLANPDDEVSARRIVNVPKRGIGDTSVARLAAWAQVEHVSFSEAIDRAAEAGLSGKALKGAEQLSKTLGELRPLVQTVNPADFVQLVAERTGYLAELVAEHNHEADGRIENLAELASQAADFDDVLGFLETVALVADSDELDSDGTRVSLMTLHTAKGLEYPAVFVVGLEEGIFPHFRSLSEPSELEEERRLFYVGITRARQHLAISHAWSRTTWGRTQPAMPSRFVTEVPSHLVEDVGLGSPRRGSGYDTLSGEEHLPGAVFSPAVPLATAARARAGGGGSGGLARSSGSPGQHRCRGPRSGRRRRGGARPLGPRRRGQRQGRRFTGPGHGALRLGRQEEPAAVGHPAPEGLTTDPGLASAPGLPYPGDRMKRPYRVVVAKPGLDGHDRGAKVIARALRDAGFEVVYTGLHQTPEQVVQAVVQEDADAVGLSLLSGAHLTLVPKVVKLLDDVGRGDVLVIVGGIIPEADIPVLQEQGVAHVFTPGAPLDSIGSWLSGALDQREEALGA